MVRHEPTGSDVPHVNDHEGGLFDIRQFRYVICLMSEIILETIDPHQQVAHNYCYFLHATDCIAPTACSAILQQSE